jgi:hypothetical protein
MSAENTPTNLTFDGRGAGPSRQARIVSVAPVSPAGQTIARRARLTRALDWIAMRLVVATHSSPLTPSGRLLCGYIIAVSLSLLITLLSLVAQALVYPTRSFLH